MKDTYIIPELEIINMKSWNDIVTASPPDVDESEDWDDLYNINNFSIEYENPTSFN